MRVFHEADPDMKRIYSKAHYVENGIGENWMIRWGITHTFRNRDNQNRNASAHREQSQGKTVPAAGISPFPENLGHPTAWPGDSR